MTKEAAAAPAARTLFTGDFHPVLEDAFLGHVTGAIGSDPLGPVSVVVPTNFLGSRLSKLLAGRAGGHLNVRFLTLRDLALAAATAPLPEARSLLPPRGDAVVVRRLLEDGTARGGHFAKVADRPGLAKVILGAVRDLKEASYTPKSYLSAARSAGLTGGSKRGKHAEVARIWSAYEDFLSESRFADESDVMRFAAEALGSGGARDLDDLIVYGFYDLNALQKRLLEARIGDGGATVFFPCVDVPACSYARPTLEWFLSIGFERRDHEPEPRAIQRPPETIVLSAPGEAREAREAVRAVRRVVEAQDTALQDVAVIVRAPEVYADVLASELDRLCDPGLQDRRLASERRTFLETPSRLSRTRSGISLLKLAQAVRSDFARADLIEFLCVSDLDPAAYGGGTAYPPVSDWNAISALAGVTAGAAAWLAKTGEFAGRLARGDANDSFAQAHARLKEPSTCLYALLKRLLEPLSGLSGTSTIEAYLDTVASVFLDVTRPGRERDEVLAAADKMRGVSSLAGRVPFGYFVELLHEYVDAPSPPGSRFGTGGPSVLSVMSARGLSYSVAVVPGLVEKQFPLHRRQDPILLDFERERLNAQRGSDPRSELPLRGPGIDEERLLFRLAVGSARDVLILTYPRLDPATARPRVPSVFVLDALNEITGVRHDYAKLEESRAVTRVPLSRRFPNDRRHALTREEFDGCSVLEAIATGNVAEIAYLVGEGEPLRPRLRMELTRWSKPYFTEFDGVLSSDEALEASSGLSGFTPTGHEPSRAVSATALEEYARCPFRFYVRRVLGIEPWEEPVDALEFAPIDRGSLYHEILERFLRDMRSSDRLPLDESALDDLLKLADRTANSDRWSLAGYPGARAMELRGLRLNLSVWLRDEITDVSGLLPAHFEVRFGGSGNGGDDGEISTEERVLFDAGEGVAIEFGGRIDRIDISRDGRKAKVIDYKTGSGKGVKKPLDRGRHLQLPVYLLAADSLLRPTHPGVRTEEAEYRFVTGGRRGNPVAFSASLLDERMDDLRTTIRHLIHGISSGMFFPYPEKTLCGYCDYARACGSAAQALAVMKSGDPRARFFICDLVEMK